MEKKMKLLKNDVTASSLQLPEYLVLAFGTLRLTKKETDKNYYIQVCGLPVDSSHRFGVG
jgi:hypothetical protein